MSTAELLQEASVLAPRLPDDFCRLILAGGLRVVQDSGNPARLHFFAPGIREILNHTLKTLAPTREVKRCAWFEVRKGKDEIWRVDRARYVLHAGLSPFFVRDVLQFDVDDVVLQVVDAIERLNKLTHVKAETLVSDDDVIGHEATRVLKAFNEMFDVTEFAREQLEEALQAHCPQTVFEAAIATMIEEVDILATQHSVEDVAVYQVDIKSLDAATIRFTASGELDVELQWGRGDDAAELSHSFGFTVELTASTADPFEVTVDEGTLRVENDSWFETDEFDDELSP